MKNFWEFVSIGLGAIGLAFVAISLYAIKTIKSPSYEGGTLVCTFTIALFLGSIAFALLAKLNEKK